MFSYWGHSASIFLLIFSIGCNDGEFRADSKRKSSAQGPQVGGPVVPPGPALPLDPALDISEPDGLTPGAINPSDPSNPANPYSPEGGTPPGFDPNNPWGDPQTWPGFDPSTQQAPPGAPPIAQWPNPSFNPEVPQPGGPNPEYPGGVFDPDPGRRTPFNPSNPHDPTIPGGPYLPPPVAGEPPPSDAPPIVRDDSRFIDVGCRNYTRVQIQRPRDVRVIRQIRGALCPVRQDKTIKVTLLVDFSASMEDHDKIGVGPRPGRDPFQNGTCYRLETLKAKISKLQAMPQPENIHVSMIPFAGEVRREEAIPRIRGPIATKLGIGDLYLPLNVFAEQLNTLPAERFCAYVPQAQRPQLAHGLPRYNNVSSGTNYEAALEAAKQKIQSLESRWMGGRNEILFISDDEPTIPKDDPVGRAIAAARDLRADVFNLTFDAILLGPEVNPDPNVSGAGKILAEISGQQRILHARNAQELPQVIDQFQDPVFNPGTIENSLVLLPPPGDGGQPFPARSPNYQIAPAQTSPGVWTYTTQPFVLLGKPGRDWVQRIVVRGVATDGTDYANVVDLVYRQL